MSRFVFAAASALAFWIGALAYVRLWKPVLMLRRPYRVTAVRPEAGQADPAKRRLQDLLSAIHAAIADDELEVAALIGRRYAEEQGGLEKLDEDELVPLAAAFATCSTS